MKVSNGFVKTAFKVKRMEDNKILDCFIQEYDYGAGVTETRFNIGINGYNEWNFLYYLNEEKFNKEFEIV